MKKLIITSIAIVTVAGATSFVLLNQPEQEALVSTKALTVDGYVEPVTVPKALEEVSKQEVVESTVSINKPATSTQEAVIEETKAPLTYDEVFMRGIQLRDSYQFKNSELKLRAVYSIPATYNQNNPGVINRDNLDERILSCYAYLDTLLPHEYAEAMHFGKCNL